MTSKSNPIYARQAIETRYHGPANVKGSRVSATASAGRVILDWDDALGIEANHTRAAAALCAKYGWHGTLAVGSPKAGGFVWVFVEPDTTVTF